MWTTVCTSVVFICEQYCWPSDPRKGSTDRRSVYGPYDGTQEASHLCKIGISIESVSKKCPENVKRIAYWLLHVQVHQEKSAKNGLVQRSMNPIDGPSFDLRTVDVIRRSQDIVENGLKYGLANKDWLKLGTDHIHDTPSTDRRFGSWVDAVENLTMCETTDVDYGLYNYGFHL
uniref:Uncharacterized protein n=1 Tax=Solanum tuberosum TaxID=4113 RepID=M1DLG2_SOLTU